MELGVAEPVPAFNAPAVPHQLQWGVLCGSQAGEKEVPLVGRKARTRKAFRPCRDASSAACRVAENPLLQDFQPPAPNRCRAGDITYIRTIRQDLSLIGLLLECGHEGTSFCSRRQTFKQPTL